MKPAEPQRYRPQASPDAPLPGKLIFSSTFDALKDTILDIAPTATSCRYRLLNINAFLHDRQLLIYEFEEFPNTYGAFYSVISYVWRGNPLVSDPSSSSYWTEDLGTFSVKGAEDGDPISLDVLYHTCTAALDSAPNAPYLWLDRLCILQSDRQDKAWQIKQMYEIYRYCKMCCILPGGIQRLVTLDEETSWIHRAWTLQEAIVPHRTLVIFMADEDRLDELRRAGKGVAIYNPITDVIPGLSAYGELRSLLELSMADPDNPCISVFGRKRAPIATLFGAVIKQNTHAYIEKDLKEQTIWQCALMRTSSRPVDMVLSIMGLFGVSLDPLQFDKNDRLKATIALASTVASYVGGKAHWLTAAYQLDPCRQLSTFPEFPDTSVDGSSYFSFPDGSRKLVADVIEERCDFHCWLSGLPEGKMDEEGYFTFSGKAVPVALVTQHIQKSDSSNPVVEEATGKIFVHAENGTVWEVCDDKDVGGVAIYIGKQMSYLYRGNSKPSRNQSRHIVLLVQEHSPGKFHRVTYSKLDDNYESVLSGLATTELSVGGPFPQV